MEYTLPQLFLFRPFDPGQGPLRGEARRETQPTFLEQREAQPGDISNVV